MTSKSKLKKEIYKIRKGRKGVNAEMLMCTDNGSGDSTVTKIEIVSHDGYKMMKEAIQRYEENLRQEAEEMMNKFETDKYESDKATIQKTKRGTKKPVEGLKEGMVGVKTELVQDTRALNDYVKEKGKLPEGWVEIVTEYIKFTIK
jgi:hypothetical protein